MSRQYRDSIGEFTTDDVSPIPPKMALRQILESLVTLERCDDPDERSRRLAIMRTNAERGLAYRRKATSDTSRR